MVIQSQAGSELCGHQPILSGHTRCSLQAGGGSGGGGFPQAGGMVQWDRLPCPWVLAQGGGRRIETRVGCLDKQELCHTPHEGVRQWDLVCGGWFRLRMSLPV